MTRSRTIGINGIKVDLRQIPGGSFTFGSGAYLETPKIEMHLTRDYWMMATLVTQELWQAVMKTATPFP